MTTSASSPSAIRRAYDAFALFAVLNMFAAGGVTAYLIGTGVITGEKLRGFVEYLRQPEPGNDAKAVTKETEGEAAPDTAESQDWRFDFTGNPLTTEILRREAERIKAELDQRLALNNSILLRITQEREAFRDEQAEVEAQKEAEVVEQESVGFDKQVELFNALAPKVAVQHLLAMPDLEDAARMLLELDTRRARKIIEAAKQPEQLQRMKMILQKVKEVAPLEGADLESGE